MKLLFIAYFLISSTYVFAGRTPEEQKVLFQKSTQELKQSGVENKIPKIGDTFPDLVLGKKKVSQWLSSGMLVVTFYRGGWCPYCVKQLKDLNESLSRLTMTHANLIAISPETELEVKKTKSKNDLEFLLLSDHKNKLAKELQIVFQVNKEVVSEYMGLGIKLEKNEETQAYELPIPATFVINSDRKIIYVFADADYTKRANTSDIIEVIKKSQKK
jgi:peroxiredoxin